MEKNGEKSNVAAIFGVSGLVGKELAKRLLLNSSSKWKVYGIARRKPNEKSTIISNPNYHFISCNLLNPQETQEKLSCLDDVTHIFWVTWASQFPLDSKECCQQNKEMMSNMLNAILPKAKLGLNHFSLQTGIKHYLSLQGPDPLCNGYFFYHEQCPRSSNVNNFYYVLEDLLKERLQGKIPWSVHRPGLIMGSSQTSLYNFIGSLCVYGTICKKLKIPFIFGGTKECWEENYIDSSDARLVAEQHIWASTNSAIQSNNGQAFNAVNGFSFRWKEIWADIGLKLGLEMPKKQEENMLFCEEFRFAVSMGDKGGLWKEIVREEGLVKTEMEDLANWEFLDVLFRLPIRMLGSRDKIDKLGFIMRYQTLDSIVYWIDAMRQEKLIP
ncbi:hypothetical protein M9H77_05957 [Catharanthus roseus]|uniref:Uncharacterized protein n=1 Tax=Catharanthus roseus TaxID=4058 RepID=A0ACC0BQR4_CATRO|nr:hypothetical protein M9H77_05957 [Catharanthus roseus]